MSIAREQFLGRIEALQSILQNPIAIDTSPVPAVNSAAVAVRNGCMVMLFCALEGFIRTRSLECARGIDQTTVPYTHLPEGLKVASLISTFEGLMQLSKSLTLADKIVEFEKAAVATATGSLGAGYQFTEYSFARDKSNIVAEDLPKISKAFGVESFWQATRSVAAKAGIAIPGNMDEVFRQLAKERHKAAHVSSYNVSHSFLQNALLSAVSLSLGFDVLVSRAAERLSRSAIARGSIPQPISGADVDFLKVRPHGNKWAAFSPANSRALFIEPSPERAMSRAVPMAQRRALDILCLDASGRPTSWRSVLG